jgi:hypothetical protein
MSPILVSYNKSLIAFSLVTDDEDMVSQKQPTGTLSPMKVDGRRLVLPTKAWQRKGYGEDYQPYHPGCEVMSREGTSPVIQMMQRQAKASIAHAVVSMGQGLLQVAVDKDTHKDLPLECTEFLKKLSNADKTTKELFEKLISAAVKKNRLLTVYLKNGGQYDGKKVNRSCIIRFPIVEDLKAESKDNVVLGVTVPKKQRPTLIALFDLIVPNGENPEEYSFGTTARVAPYFISLLTAFHKIASVLNELIEAYAVKLHIPVKPFELYDLSIVDDIIKHYDDIPPYSGNEGKTDAQPEEASETVSVVKKAAVAKAQAEKPREAVPQLVRGSAQVLTSAVPATVEHVGKKAASMADFMNATQPQATGGFQQHQQPQLNTGFVPVTFNQQQPQYAPQSFNGNFNGGGNSFAPAPVAAPAWMGGGQPAVNQGSANPFMAATMTGHTGNNGGLGLI